METNINCYEEDDEISFVNLIGYVFRHLKKMLIISIVVAIVLGGLLGYKKTMNSNNDSDDIDINSINVLDKKIDTIKTNINDYINNSSFFELDFNNSYQAIGLYLVDTGYEIMPNSIYQNYDYTNSIIDVYLSLLKSEDLLSNIADKYEISKKEIADYIYITSYDCLIDINVFNKSEEQALSILHDIEEYLFSFKEKVSSAVVEHDITKISTAIYHGVNNNIMSVQQTKLNILNENLINLENLQTQFDSFVTAQNEKSYSFINEFIKYGVLGFVSTFILFIIYYALKFIFSDKVYSINEFKNKMNIRVLGNLTYTKSGKYIRWINKLEKRPVTNDFKLITSNITAYSGTDKILISGDIEDNIKTDIVQNLQKILTNIEILSCGSFLTDSNAIDKLNDSNSVILLVKCSESSYKNIKEEKEKLNDLKVADIYVIVID